MREETIGFVGAGQMAEAIARGIISAGLYRPASIVASDVSETRRGVFENFGVRTRDINSKVVQEADVIVIAVKPQNVDDLLKELGPMLDERRLVITICAGCATTIFEAASRGKLRVVRAMPNLAAKVRQGSTAICGGNYATEDDVATAKSIFEAVGRVEIVEESMMDAVTALSGSGPAYFFYLLEAMIEAGIREGLSQEAASSLAIQTAKGAAELIVAEKAGPDELRRRVTSKGGTTEAAVKKLDELHVREAFLQAIHAAVLRAQELGRK